MLLLAIDSSSEIGTLALGRDNELLTEYHFYHKLNLLRRILQDIEQIFADAGHTVNDTDGIVVSLGPGSFTGLRIGVTVAKSLAYALEKPIVGVGTLDAIARGVAPSGTELICPMIRARADEVYWSLFDSTGTLRIADYAVDKIDNVLEVVAERGVSVYFCGSGATLHAEAIRHRFGTQADVGERWTSFARGAAILDIGHRLLREGIKEDPLTLVPLYVRKPTPVVRLETGEFEKGSRRRSPE
jgi:tRNA threonylcarbamoyl adenosine modification protein YeaZ